MGKDIVFFSVEILNWGPEGDEITEFSALRTHEGQLIKSCNLVSPLSEHRQTILDIFDDAVLVGHQSVQNLNRLGVNLNTKFRQTYWDTLELARIFFPTVHHYQLSYLSEKLLLDTKRESRFCSSEENAWITWRLFEVCWKKGLEFDLSFFTQVLSILENWSLNGFFEELQKEVGRNFPDRPIHTDLVLATAPNDLFVQKQVSNVAETMSNFVDWVLQCFSTGGTLEKALPGYESRPGQLRMAKLIAEALSSSQHVVLEAGTGIGKSLAYLIPCIYSAKKTGQKVVVATHTIPLQEQLLNKDVPIVTEVMPFSFNVSVLKGKSNYLCLKRWQSSLSNHKEFPNGEQKLALLRILVWLRETLTGDLQELSNVSGLMQIWSSLSADNEACIPNKCSKSGACFLLRARKKAEESDVVIVNHSLLFSDLKADFNVLPEYNYLVIDEAHQIYRTAMQHLGSQITLENVLRILANIYRAPGSGFYGMIKQRLLPLKEWVGSVDWGKFEEGLENLPSNCNSIAEQAEELFNFLLSVLGTQRTFRFVASHTGALWWKEYNIQTENLIGRIRGLITTLENLSRILGEDPEEMDDIRYVLSGHVRDLQELLDTFALVLMVENTKQVIWLELNSTLYLKASPIDISDILKEKVFSRLKAAVLTSATLSIANSFEHFLDEIGLPLTTLTAQIESPFDYERQMQFFVVKNGLDLYKSDEERALDLAEFIVEVAERMNGRTLVLFTALKFLGETYAHLMPKLKRKGIETLAQGSYGERSILLEAFKRNPKSVLLGANSFWEGIDIPGDTLSCVILVKLPFWPPSLPLIEARSEFLKSQERDPFQELLLPEAVIRFKQGFGRLIRTKHDRGLVILMDDRAIRKYYGRYFLGSLPVSTHIRGENDRILRKIEEWNSVEFNEVL